MAWPQPTEYFEAVQNPSARLADPDLAGGQVVRDALGLPVCCSGNFADVYQIRGPDDQSWAVKCFTREIPGLEERYQHISRHLGQAGLQFLVSFQYQDRGIRIQGQWFPILKMRWVEGDTLNRFVEKNLDRPALLEVLLQLWLKLAGQLRQAEITHCDLQHGNVLLVPRANGKVRLTLVDYDGMMVPALAGQPSGELGHPSYQHPQRLRDGSYCPQIDHFSHLVICCGLRALISEGKNKWDRHDNGDNLLFRPEDFAHPADSALFQELWDSPEPRLHALTGRLILACGSRLEDLPPLDSSAEGDFAPDLERQVRGIMAEKQQPEPKPTRRPAPRQEPWWIGLEKTAPPARAAGPAAAPAVVPAPILPPSPPRADAGRSAIKPGRLLEPRFRRLLWATIFFALLAGLAWWADGPSRADEDHWLKTIEDQYQSLKEKKSAPKKIVQPAYELDFKENAARLVTGGGQEYHLRDDYRVRFQDKDKVRILDTPTRRLVKYWAKFRDEWGYSQVEEDRSAILGMSPEVVSWLFIWPMKLCILFAALALSAQVLHSAGGPLRREFFWGIGMLELALLAGWTAGKGMFSSGGITWFTLLLVPVAAASFYQAGRMIRRSG